MDNELYQYLIDKGVKLHEPDEETVRLSEIEFMEFWGIAEAAMDWSKEVASLMFEPNEITIVTSKPCDKKILIQQLSDTSFEEIMGVYGYDR